jgi:hypothetical protein
MGNKAFDFEEMTSMTSSPVPPPTHRPKVHGMKSFDFDNSKMISSPNDMKDDNDNDTKGTSPSVRMSIDDDDYEVLPPANNQVTRPFNVPSFPTLYNRSRSNSSNSTGSNSIVNGNSSNTYGSNTGCHSNNNDHGTGTAYSIIMAAA